MEVRPQIFDGMNMVFIESRKKGKTVHIKHKRIHLWINKVKTKHNNVLFPLKISMRREDGTYESKGTIWFDENNLVKMLRLLDDMRHVAI